MMVVMYKCYYSSRRRHTRWPRDWSSDVCSSDLFIQLFIFGSFNRQHHPGFDRHKKAGHVDKFTGYIQVQLFHKTNILQKLPGDMRDGDIVNIQFITPYKEQEKIQRPLKIFKLYSVHAESNSYM